MIRATVLYPKQEGSTFNMEYYSTIHTPMAQQLLGATEVSIDEGLEGGVPGSPAPYMAICHLMFESLEAYHSRIGAAVAQLMADVPNYTNVAPIIQISEVKR